MKQVKLAILILFIIVGANAVTVVWWAKREAEITKTISYTHWLSVSIQSYLKSEGHFPATLGDMINTKDMYLSPTNTFFPGTHIQYYPPHLDDSDNTTILTVTYRGAQIKGTKGFARTENRRSRSEL